jgi:hypothetical protein
MELSDVERPTSIGDDLSVKTGTFKRKAKGAAMVKATWRPRKERGKFEVMVRDGRRRRFTRSFKTKGDAQQAAREINRVSMQGVEIKINLHLIRDIAVVLCGGRDAKSLPDSLEDLAPGALKITADPNGHLLVCVGHHARLVSLTEEAFALASGQDQERFVRQFAGEPSADQR